MTSPPDSIAVLQLLVKLTKAKTAIEVGVFTGFLSFPKGPSFLLLPEALQVSLAASLLDVCPIKLRQMVSEMACTLWGSNLVTAKLKQPQDRLHERGRPAAFKQAA